MMALIPTAPPAKKSLISKRVVIASLIIAAIVFSIVIVYFYLSFSSIFRTSPTTNLKLPASHINATIKDQDVLSYSNIRQLVPFVLLSYTASNVTSINANISILTYPAPQKIYILNDSNECFDCGNSAAIGRSIDSSLIKYGLIQTPSDVSTISPSNLRSIQPDSILIIINGLLPSAFVNSTNNASALSYLLGIHTSILYVGDNFSRVLLPDSVVTPAPSSMPQYLATVKHPPFNGLLNTYYFNKSTFSFFSGQSYQFLTYINVDNGSIAAFPNTPNSWNSSNQTGRDIAKAVYQLFWLPKYAYGSRTVTTASRNSSGQFGVPLNSIFISSNSLFASQSSATGSIRVVLAANAVYQSGNSNNTYKYIYARPNILSNGTIGMQNSIIIGQNVPINFTIHTNVLQSAAINTTPYIDIYDLNMTQVYTSPTPFLHGIFGNFTFLIYENLLLPPGRSYIIELHSFYGTEYAAALFNAYPVKLNILRQNFTTDSFLFSVTSNNQPISGINYTMSLNNIYPKNGTIQNGLINYSLPSGTPSVSGILNFTLSILGSKSYVITQNYPATIMINEQYIEVAAVVVVMLLMIILVRAPNRDEFYIDVPALPEEQKTMVDIKASEITAAFDKLNTSYHWKFMPLSKPEIRSAISGYIKHNNMPISLTYNNVERILDKMAVNKYLVTIDDLYAPSQWIQQSNHDIEYLATFKKLRIYLVTHSYIFTDLDISTNADIVATLRNEKRYIVIYSKTSRFQKVPVYTGSKTYIVFLNSYKLEEFRSELYNSQKPEAEELKMYISAEIIKLVEADDPSELLE
jgi:hypothetical protein